MVTVASTATFALFFAQLLYLQFMVLIWGAALMAVIVLYERESKGEGSRPIGLGDMEEWPRLTSDLAAVEERLSKAVREDVRQILRRQKAYLEQELRSLSWSIKEVNMERARFASSPQGLKQLPSGTGWWRRAQLGRRERAHLHECLELAAEAMLTDSEEAAKEELKLVANDLRAHYDLLKSLRPQSKTLGDYGTAWAVLTSISKGADSGVDLAKYASKRSRSRLLSLLDMAASRGLLQGASKAVEDSGSQDSV